MIPLSSIGTAACAGNLDQITAEFNCEFERFFYALNAEEKTELESALKFCFLTAERQLLKTDNLLFEISGVPLNSGVQAKSLFFVKKLDDLHSPKSGELRAQWCLNREGDTLFLNGLAAKVQQQHPEAIRQAVAFYTEDRSEGEHNSGFHIRTEKGSLEFSRNLCEAEGVFVLEALQKNDRQFATNEPALPSVNHIPDISFGLFCTSESGEVVYVNDAFAGYFGYSTAEDFRAEISNIVQVYKVQATRKSFLNLVKSKGQIESIDGEFVRRDGSMVRISGLVSSFRDNTDKTLYLQGAVLASATNSVTDRILQPYISLFESFNDGVAVVNLDGEIVYSNKSLQDLFESEPGELAGKSPDGLFIQFERGETETDRSSEKKILSATIREGNHSGRYVYITKSGRKVVTAVSCTVVKSIVGISGGIVMLVRDITLKVEEQRQLLLAKQRADEANRLKESVLSNLSHETRTPLTSIIGFSSILCEYLNDADEEIKSFADNIIKSAEQLLCVINNLLLLAEQELKKSKYPVAEVDLSEVILGLIPDFEKDARESGLDFRHTVLPELVAETNESAVGTILTMICANAIKFTEKGFVSVKTGRINGSYIFIDIKDTGVGIRPEMIDQIFDPFTQEIFGTTRIFPGAGLGLSVCRKLAAIINAEILVQSQKGKGSVFRILIPVRHSEKG